jgi:hypothetical protein
MLATVGFDNVTGVPRLHSIALIDERNSFIPAMIGCLRVEIFMA